MSDRAASVVLFISGYSLLYVAQGWRVTASVIAAHLIFAGTR